MVVRLARGPNICTNSDFDRNWSRYSLVKILQRRNAPLATGISYGPISDE